MPTSMTLAEAAERLTTARRVLVMGCSGGGKTRLSYKIADRYGLSYQSYDRDVRWLPGWRVRALSEQRARVAALANCDRWVMDGNSPSTFDIRLPRADMVIWLRVPRHVALLGIARRVVANHGSVRADMAEGCPEHWPDRQFLAYIWHFEQKTAPRIIAGLNKHGPCVPVVTLNTRQQADELLAR